jgi:hypothetical protein
MQVSADHDELASGSVDIDLVAHGGGNPRGWRCFTLTVTDIATGWMQNRPPGSRSPSARGTCNK